jgi:hypothetical protein
MGSTGETGNLPIRLIRERAQQRPIDAGIGPACRNAGNALKTTVG